MTVESPLKTISRIAFAILFISTSQLLNALTYDSRHDPYPVFTSLDPHIFLQTRERDELKNFPVEWNRREWFAFSISPFGQNANNGRNLCHKIAELGDLSGRWGMIGMLMGAKPIDAPPTPTLDAARDYLFPRALFPTNNLNVPAAIDGTEQFGFFKVPLNYRKRGARFDIYSKISNDFGVNVKIGVADIAQRLSMECIPVSTTSGETTDYSYTGCETVINDCGFVNMTNEATLSGEDVTASICIDSTNAADFNYTDTSESSKILDQLDVNNVNAALMCRLQTIADEIHLDIKNFEETGVEDVRAGLYWRHAFLFNNESTNPCWEEFLLIPFVLVEGSVASFGKQRNRQKAFALSFGNDDHEAMGFTGGINIDFAETIEIGGEAGFTHFFERRFCNMPIPTSELQSGIFPYSTDVNVSPGNNWHFGAKLSARHFVGCLSVYAQYFLVNHDPDCIRLRKPDPAFKPRVLEERSAWRSQLANVGFNYDISQTISLGLFWQAPLSQVNCYKSTTILGSFNAIF